MTSSTIFNAFINPLELQRVSLGGTLLMCLWSLSPLGGQASLRIIYKSNQTLVSPVPLRYMDTGPTGMVYIGEMVLISYDGELSPSIPQGYGAALMQSNKTKVGPEDAWGNFKVPRIESLDSSTMRPDGWIPFTAGTVEVFSSLLGLPVEGIPSIGFANFSVESSYLTLTCPSYEPTHNNTNPIGYFNVTFPPSPDGTCLEDKDRIRMLLGVNTTAATNPSELFAQEVDLYSSNQETYSRCTVYQTNVETNVQCADGGCQPVAVRRSMTDHRPNNITVFDYWGVKIALGITQASAASPDFLSASEHFLHDTSLFPISPLRAEGAPGMANFSSIPQDLFATRASILLSTYAQLVLSSTGFTGNLPPTNVSFYGPEYTVPATALKNSTFSTNISNAINYTPCDGDPPHWMLSLSAPFVGASTTATHALVSEVYLVNYGWAAAMFLSAVTLLCTAVTGAVLRRQVKGPDVFDPVAAWTYDNPSLPVPSDGTAMDIGQRIRALKNVEVRVGDVWGGREIGKIALGRKSETGKLIEGRLYV
jgi:hypothetical protein